MLGVTTDPLIIGDLVVPPTANGVRCLSMGYFVPDDTPVIWRGPMLHKALEQFLVDAYWGEPDFLLIDMPPGTGDVTLSLGQYLTKTEVYVVTTPQPAAERVAQRSAYAARKLKLAVRGVIENMSWFTGDDGTRYELFGAGGGAQLADELGVPLLAQVPLVPALRQGGDEGVPTVAAEPESEVAAIFDRLASSIVDLGPARVYRRSSASAKAVDSVTPPRVGGMPLRPPVSGTTPEHLVDGQAPVVEAVGRRRHVQAPDVGPGQTDQGDRLVPVLLQVGDPVVQGPGVVLPQRLDVAHLEPGPLHGSDHLGHVHQLAVGEDVAADEGPLGRVRILPAWRWRG